MKKELKNDEKLLNEELVGSLTFNEAMYYLGVEPECYETYKNDKQFMKMLKEMDAKALEEGLSYCFCEDICRMPDTKNIIEQNEMFTIFCDEQCYGVYNRENENAVWSEKLKFNRETLYDFVFYNEKDFCKKYPMIDETDYKNSVAVVEQLSKQALKKVVEIFEEWQFVEPDDKRLRGVYIPHTPDYDNDTMSYEEMIAYFEKHNEDNVERSYYTDYLDAVLDWRVSVRYDFSEGPYNFDADNYDFYITPLELGLFDLDELYKEELEHSHQDIERM